MRGGDVRRDWGGKGAGGGQFVDAWGRMPRVAKEAHRGVVMWGVDMMWGVVAGNSQRSTREIPREIPRAIP